MNIQKHKDTRSGAKHKPAAAPRWPSKVVKKAPRAKQLSARNTVKPTTSHSREATARPAASKRPLPQALVPQPVRESSKLNTVLAMLRAPDGTTIVDIMKVTGWQSHSVRGFLTGVIRKRLKLELVSDKVDGERRYRIGKAAASK